jgi:hypothetical protein
MGNSQHLVYYVYTISNDKRLNVWHKSLLIALINLSLKQNLLDNILISRRQLMLMAGFKSLATYHKYLKDLIDFKYCTYFPSYDPRVRSRISIQNIHVTSLVTCKT